jgi:hypothetical protein
MEALSLSRYIERLIPAAGERFKVARREDGRACDKKSNPGIQRGRLLL